MAFVDELAAEHGDRLDLRIDDEGSGIDVGELVASVPVGGELYVCGPTPMLDAIKAAWAAAGRKPAELRFETFGSSGRFAPEPFRVRIPRLGLETTVPHDVSMLEALEACGADMMFDCRRGECGLCQVKVLDVAGRRSTTATSSSATPSTRRATGCSAACRASSAPAPAGWPRPTAFPRR